MSSVLRLSESELNLALSYIENVGESDFFPRPFEIEAIRHGWDDLKPALMQTDLMEYQPRPLSSLMALKRNYTVRPVKLVDPIDAIFYTGLALRLAAPIQRRRDTYQDQRVFSFRFTPPETSTDLPVVSDWEGYALAAKDGAEHTSAVAVADIADFFPRIYLHRLENSLADLSGDPLATRAIMQFLKEWGDGTSYGIPVGLRASNLIAEALLVEVDEYLLSEGAHFIRYADDYIFFGAGEAECGAALFRLGSRLFITQGLTLNDSKTRTWDSDEFLKRRAAPPSHDMEIRDEIIADVLGGDPYAVVNLVDLTPAQQAKVAEVDAQAWLEAALSEEPADLPTIRFVLNFLSALRRPELVEPVIANLPRLLAVSDAVARFLSVFPDLDSQTARGIGDRILQFVQHGEFVPDYQAIWLLEPFMSAAT